MSRLIDGHPEPVFVKGFIFLHAKKNTERSLERSIKQETIEYIKECAQDNFISFRQALLDKINNEQFKFFYCTVYRFMSLEDFNAQTEELTEFRCPYVKIENIAEFLDNIRNIKILEYFSTLEDIYQFVFVLQFCKIKDTNNNYSFEEKLNLAYKEMPSHFFLTYIDEGVDIDKPSMKVIFSELLSANSDYKEMILEYAKTEISIIETDRNDVGDILFASESLLAYLDQTLKIDMDFSKQLLSLDINLLRYMHDDIRNNKEIVKHAYIQYIKNPMHEINHHSGYFGNSLYDFFIKGIGDTLKSDSSFMADIVEIPFNKDEYLKKIEEQNSLNNEDADDGLPF